MISPRGSYGRLVATRSGQAVPRSENGDLFADRPPPFGSMLISTERYDEAEAVCSKLPPALLDRDGCLARARFGKGEIAEAIHLLTNASSGVLTNPEFRGFLGYFYAKAAAVTKLATRAASQYPNDRR